MQPQSYMEKKNLYSQQQNLWNAQTDENNVQLSAKLS